MELEAQQVNLEELLSTLRDSTPGSSAARLTEWHAKLGELRLVELRLNRANQQLSERVKHLEEAVSTTEQSCAKLEQDLVTLTKVCAIHNTYVKGLHCLFGGMHLCRIMSQVSCHGSRGKHS